MKKLLWLASAAIACLPGALRAETLLPRFPNVHGNSIVFVAAGNLWTVDAKGGDARRLTSGPGQDLLPRYSPDGNWIAFTAGYQGNTDVYVIPAKGGQARRLTFHSDVFYPAVTRRGPDNMVVTWTPDSKNVVFRSRAAAWNDWLGTLYTVPVSGGLPVEMPLDSSGFATFGPDGHSIAYNRIFRDFRTWKRYQGGLAQQVFTYDFETKALTQVTHWKGTNAQPMWRGDKIYYLADADANRRANIWVHDLKTGEERQVTHFTDYDIDFPSLGDSGIAFQQGGKLWVIDLPDETLREVRVDVPDDGTRTAPHFVDATKQLRRVDIAQVPDYALSPNGKRAAFSARGDLYTVPAEEGVARNLTRSSHADEDHPAFSPDGALIAYTTDTTGGQQLAVRPSAGGAERVLTQFETGYLYSPVFSPDGKQIAVSDNLHRVWIVPAEGGPPRQVAQDRFQEVHDYAFSPDSRYLVFSMRRDQNESSLWLYDLSEARLVPISTGEENDFAPLFTRDGKYLLFVSNRHETAVASDTEFNIAALKTTGIYAVPLTRDTPSLFAPKSDEAADTRKPEAKKDADRKPVAPVKIDLDGLMARAELVPTEAAGIGAYDVAAGKIFYLTQPPQTFEGPLPGEQPELRVYDLEKRKDTAIGQGMESFVLSADGTKILYAQKGAFLLTDAKEGKPEPKPLKLTGLKAWVEPRAEWREIFENAWRLQRDFYFNPAMNGADWRMVHDRYEKLLPRMGSREDLNWLIGQVLGEIGNSHTYVGGGDDFDPTKYVPVSLLGADLALDAGSGRYRIEKIYAGDNTREDYRGPLSAPGLNVAQGAYLRAIDGVELKAPTNPYSLLAGAPDQVTLTLSDTPDGKTRDITVRPVKVELPLREKAWIDASRATVDRLSKGRVGYIYLSDMSALGMQQFLRQFATQMSKDALIVDDRWNGGGFIDQIVLERLRRTLVGTDVNREAAVTLLPQQLHNGPKICLINHYSASDGDIFPHNFRAYGLGKLLGTRTWGGVRGIRGNMTMLDGGYVTVPEFSMADAKPQASWVMENYGVTPDIEVENEPGELAAGHDRQLEQAVALMLKELEAHPPVHPKPPAFMPAYPPEGDVAPPK